MQLDPMVVLASIGAITTAVIGAGVRKVWVWGWTYVDMEKDRDFWRSRALRGASIAEQAIGTTEKAISIAVRDG